jgi:hypothetical protein
MRDSVGRRLYDATLVEEYANQRERQHSASGAEPAE